MAGICQQVMDSLQTMARTAQQIARDLLSFSPNGAVGDEKSQALTKKAMKLRSCDLSYMEGLVTLVLDENNGHTESFNLCIILNRAGS